MKRFATVRLPDIIKIEIKKCFIKKVKHFLRNLTKFFECAIF